MHMLRNLDAASRSAALAGAVGPLLFVVGVVLAATRYPGYSHVSQAISELGGAAAPVPWLQNANFLLLGMAILGLAWALSRSLGPPHRGPALIGFFGLSSAVANGLLPCDIGCQGATTVGLLHNLTGLAGFVAALLGMVALARRWQADPDWRAHAAFTRGAAVVGAVGLVGFVATKAAKLESIDGLVQRVFVAALLVWVAGTSVRLLRDASGHTGVDVMLSRRAGEG